MRTILIYQCYLNLETEGKINFLLTFTQWFVTQSKLSLIFIFTKFYFSVTFPINMLFFEWLTWLKKWLLPFLFPVLSSTKTFSRHTENVLHQIGLNKHFFLKILKKKRCQGLSSQTLIISDWTHHALFLFKLLFNHVLFTDFFTPTMRYKALSNVSKQV